MDILSPEERSERMSRVRGKDTKPEMAVRRLLHSMGFRYRLHKDNLPGKPDIVFSKGKKVIFVNGCFWHQHNGCRAAALPKSNLDFWREKLGKNIERDTRIHKELAQNGWSQLIVWECEINDPKLRERLLCFLKSS